jgi:flagellar protein FliT
MQYGQEQTMAPNDGCRDDADQHSGLLEHYEAIAMTSQEMLVAARADRWDEVGRLEERCRDLIAQLKDASAATPLQLHDDPRRVQLLRRILANDAEIRGCAEPWWSQVDDLIQGRVPATH